MEKYEIKVVSFMGDELIAARDSDGKIWAGISYICNGIGMTKHQKDRQISNIQSDRVLSKGCLKFEAGVFDPNNVTIGLSLDFVPLWLAKINITPSMPPEVADKLEQYQLRAKDVLAAAFIPPNNQPMSPVQLLNETIKALAQQAEVILDLDQRVNALTEQTAAISAQTAAISTRVENALKVFTRPDTVGDWKANTEMAIKAMSKSIRFRGRLYQELETRSGCSLNSRLTRLRNRLRGDGMTVSQTNAITKLDVIAMDKRLRNIFDAIIRERQAAIVVGETEQVVIDAAFVEAQA